MEEEVFEEMSITDQWSHLMDDSADKVQNSKRIAISLLEAANEAEERAEKLRHMAAVVILDAQSYAADIGNFMAMEFRTDLLPDSLTGEEEIEEEEEEETE